MHSHHPTPPLRPTRSRASSVRSGRDSESIHTANQDPASLHQLERQEFYSAFARIADLPAAEDGVQLRLSGRQFLRVLTSRGLLRDDPRLADVFSALDEHGGRGATLTFQDFREVTAPSQVRLSGTPSAALPLPPASPPLSHSDLAPSLCLCARRNSFAARSAATWSRPTLRPSAAPCRAFSTTSRCVEGASGARGRRWPERGVSPASRSCLGAVRTVRSSHAPSTPRSATSRAGRTRTTFRSWPA